jgi:phosphate-selective porin OprO/OprP
MNQALRFAVAAAWLTLVASDASAQALKLSSPVTDGFTVDGPHDSLKLDDKGITVKLSDDAIELQIGGRLHEDFGSSTIRPRSLGPAQSRDAEIRRAWFEPTLTIQKDIVASLQYDFSDTTQHIDDAVLSYKGFGPAMLSVGNFKEPFSFEQLMYVNNLLFTERSLLDVLAPSRNFGIAVGTHGEQWTAIAGVFGGNANSGVTRDGIAATGRVTFAPILDKTHVLHFGLAGSYRSLDRNRSALSFAETPESFLYSTSLVDTGTLTAASSVGRLGLEALYQTGPFRVQAEYAVTTVANVQNASHATFQAGFIEAAWTINGTGRPYNLVPYDGSSYAVLGGVEVPDGQRVTHGGVGIFELGVRFSAIDLNDGAVKGGREHDFTAGVNWYPDRNLKIMLDYVRADAAPSAVAVSGQAVHSDIFIGRTQIYW